MIWRRSLSARAYSVRRQLLSCVFDIGKNTLKVLYYTFYQPLPIYPFVVRSLIWPMRSCWLVQAKVDGPQRNVKPKPRAISLAQPPIKYSQKAESNNIISIRPIEHACMRMCTQYLYPWISQIPTNFVAKWLDVHKWSIRAHHFASIRMSLLNSLHCYSISSTTRRFQAAFSQMPTHDSTEILQLLFKSAHKPTIEKPIKCWASSSRDAHNF